MLVCSLHALSSQDRADQKHAWRDLLAVADKIEIQDGFEFHFDSAKFPLTRAAILMDIESRCCGFSQLELEVKAGGKTAVLRFKGPDGTKNVLNSQLEIFLE